MLIYNMCEYTYVYIYIHLCVYIQMLIYNTEKV